MSSRYSVFACSPFSRFQENGVLLMKLKLGKRQNPAPAIFDARHNQKSDGQGEYRYVHPDKIKCRKNNPREHSDGQIARIKASIEQFNFLNPILVDENYMIISGEARFRAARELNINDV